MTQYQPTDAATVIGTWGFLGSPSQEHFINSKTAPRSLAQ
jgi:hypothetical protein